MIRRWLERRRAGRQARAAADLQIWLDSSRALLALCHEPLRSTEGISDIGVVLDRIDRSLLRYRNEAAAVRATMRPRPALAAAARQATDGLFALRNETCAFLLRWQSLRQLPGSSAASIEVQRNMEEARLQASRSARYLTGELEKLAPELDRLISHLSRPSAEGPNLP